MKERSKERIALLLMEELTSRLSERDEIKRLLAEMTALPVDELMEGLLEEFEKVVRRRHDEVLAASRAKRDRRTRPQTDSPSSVSPPPPPVEPPRAPMPEHEPPPSPVKKQASPESKPSREIRLPDSDLEPVRLNVDPIEVRLPELELPPVQGRTPDTATAKRKMEEEPKRPAESKTRKSLAEQAEEIVKKVLTSEEPAVEPEDEPEPENEEANAPSAVSERHGQQRTPCQFTDDDLVYVHAVSSIPAGEQPSHEPFMLEEKGIDARSLVFAFDYENLRFYLSKITSGTMNVSKTGMLLLGKQESLQLQGDHQSILNDLRSHGVLLPFEFGTLARGKDELLGRIDDQLDELTDALETLEATTRWTVSVFVLDGKIAQLVATPDAAAERAGRGKERTSHMQAAVPKKYDIKMLERMLQKEKKLAEAIHQELENAASGADVESMVNLGSGSSEDWKLILKATYQVPRKDIQTFSRVVTDLQYHHMMFDVMIVLSGDVESVAFEK